MMGGGVGRIFGRPVAVFAGFALMVAGAVGTVLWFVDNLS